MSMINRYLHGEINKAELRAYVETHPALRDDAEAAIAKVEKADREALQAGTGKVYVGTQQTDVYNGDDADELIIGLGGDDDLEGGGGRDLIMGGAGNDVINGGTGDGADDIAFGEDGNDVYLWNPVGDGNDLFDGGDGLDYVHVSLEGTKYADLREAIEAGYIRVDIHNDPGAEFKYTRFGSLILAEDSIGTITGPKGETLQFRNVERIKGK